MRTSDFDYALPPELIAQTPIEPRDHSRLMVLDRANHAISHDRFYSLPDLLKAGDVLVFNDTRVIPARLAAVKDTGGKFEILLLQRLSPGIWQALVKPARRATVGTKLRVGEQAGCDLGDSHPHSNLLPSREKGTSGRSVEAEVVEAQDDGARILRFSDETALLAMGKIPLPPYIHAPLADPERYQTVYSRIEGSAAAPTAGLHFTPGLLEKLALKGIECVFLTLHVGLDTFQPVREDDPARHKIHREFGVVPVETATRIAGAKSDGRRVIGVGTTSTRLLEAMADTCFLNTPGPFAGWVNLFITPGYRFKVVDAMITNFHLPQTTLLMMVSAFAGLDFVLEAYRAAVEERYRFYSFGDAMWIL